MFFKSSVMERNRLRIESWISKWVARNRLSDKCGYKHRSHAGISVRSRGYGGQDGMVPEFI